VAAIERCGTPLKRLRRWWKSTQARANFCRENHRIPGFRCQSRRGAFYCRVNIEEKWSAGGEVQGCLRKRESRGCGRALATREKTVRFSLVSATHCWKTRGNDQAGIVPIGGAALERYEHNFLRMDFELNPSRFVEDANDENAGGGHIALGFCLRQAWVFRVWQGETLSLRRTPKKPTQRL